MKKAMKKLMAALLAVAMVCAMAIPAFAADGTARTGSITINGAIDGQTYNIYRILNLEANADFTAYKYTINKGWDAFVTAHNDVFTVNNGIVTSTAASNSAEVQALANAAGEYAEKNHLTADGTASSTSKTVTGLALGYYLVVSTPALSENSLCSLGTTNPNVTINEKNGKPSITKQIEYTAGSTASANDATVGDTVKFVVTINAIDGNPKNYVMHDKMEAGLTFDASSVTVKRGETILEKGTDYELITSPNDNDTFDIKFIKPVHTNDVFTVTYSATLNKNAVVGTTGNKNETDLTYGDNQRVEAEPTKTYTWSFNIFKYFMKGTEEKALDGAKFILYRKASTNSENENEYAVMDTNGKIKSWSTDETNATVLTSPVSGKLTMSGLANGTYYLKETEAPQGYNSLENDIEIMITAANWQTPKAPSAKIEYKTSTAEGVIIVEAENGTVKVENKSGTVLPGTGGIGTTIFYVIGGGLMAAAAILLITKKRMENH
jgi:fimbrial isopeptide formation D2 family protein/LPXTG-motif cell wall-anchored protein